MSPRTSDVPRFQLVETGKEHFRASQMLVLNDLDSWLIESIIASTTDAIELQGMNFAAAYAIDRRSEMDGIPTDITETPLRVLAAAYLLEYPGRLACMVGPSFAQTSVKASAENDSCSHVPLSAATEVVQALIRKAIQWKLELVQVIIDENSRFPLAPLSLTGFKQLATLSQMALDFPRKESEISADEGKHHELARASESWNDQRWRRYDPSDYAAWIDWMDATYESTQDCPELNGVRTTSETFKGYFASSGVKNESLPFPEWWALFDTMDISNRNRVFSSKSESIAAAFMLGSSGDGVWELSYMGVASSHRTLGFGRETLHAAVARAEVLNAKRLWLAVDQRNTVAIRLYEQLGFKHVRLLDAWFLSLNQ